MVGNDGSGVTGCSSKTVFGDWASIIRFLALLFSGWVLYFYKCFDVTLIGTLALLSVIGKISWMFVGVLLCLTSISSSLIAGNRFWFLLDIEVKRFSSPIFPALEYFRAFILAVLLPLYLYILSSHSLIYRLILTSDLLNSFSRGVKLRLWCNKLALSYVPSVLLKVAIFLRNASCLTFAPNLVCIFSASIFYFLASNLTRCFAFMPSRSLMCKDFVFFP